MQIQRENTSPGKISVETPTAAIIHDYSLILEAYGLEYIPSEYYWQVGEINQTQGWILHLSAVKFCLPELLNLLIPVLLKEQTPFKIVRDFDTATDLVAGLLGYIHLCKLISVYPQDDKKALQLAKLLIQITQPYKGPSIPTDRHLGSIVYTRYGSFNPVLSKNEEGQIIKYIYDDNGRLVQDRYSIPFSLPPGKVWPFHELTEPVAQKRRKLLNYSYYPLETLKGDAKGDVIKGIYFKHFWEIKLCLIKQGRRSMSIDEAGRDIQDKLKWQFDLYQELAETIPMPKIFDHFFENGDCYLTMEYIHGITLTDWIAHNYRDSYWLDLPDATKLRLLDCLLEVTRIIGLLHSKGYVHRDITPENFLIDKNNKLYLIDMELAWSAFSNKPNPPYQLGTFGFMSPQQAKTKPPAFTDDVYALGALMLIFYTNLFPRQFQSSSPHLLKESLATFIDDISISELIANCLQFDPRNRPSLIEITNVIQTYHSQFKKNNPRIQNTNTLKFKSPHEKVNQTIQAGINALSNDQFLSPEKCWVSKKNSKDQFIGNLQVELTFYEGWYVGMSGPLWLIARAKKAGFDIRSCDDAYTASLTYIKAYLRKKQSDASQSLYSGTAGIAITLAEGLNSDLLQTSDSIELINRCFSTQALQLDLSLGIAGQGIALLRCASLLDLEFVTSRLKTCLDKIINCQNADGSWDLFAPSGKKRDILLGMSKGVAGIIWFLMASLRYSPDQTVEHATIKALDWLIGQARKRKSYYAWTISSHSTTKDSWSCNQGGLGIALIFIYAYEYFKNPLFKKIAEKSLMRFPHHAVAREFKFESGIAGLGEVYLDAYRVFEDPKWKDKANWIAKVFIATFQNLNQTQGRWLPDSSDFVTGDLATGMSGILHFLIRHQSLEQFRHPLWPHNT